MPCVATIVKGVCSMGGIGEKLCGRLVSSEPERVAHWIVADGETANSWGFLSGACPPSRRSRATIYRRA